MRITRFWARGYRSLRDVELSALGPFVVFYGPNGSGKSNVLRALAALLRATRVWASAPAPEKSRFAKDLWVQGVLHADDRHRGAEASPYETVLGLEVEAPREGLSLLLAIGRTLPARARLELTVSWNGTEPYLAKLDAHFDGEPLERIETDARTMEPSADARLTLARLADELFWIIGADRALRDERVALESPAQPSQPAVTSKQERSPIVTALREGNLQTAIFHAKNDWDRANRVRFEHLLELVSSTLGLPKMDVGRDPTSGAIDLRQPLAAAPDQHDISLRSAGLGVEQVVAIVASVVFAGSRVVALEEPEAHLHAPTTGRALRKLLKRLVEPSEGAPRLVQQLFVATYSNLFDLDPSGYWDVRLEDGATRIERRELHELYEKHLYEPGPARLLLKRALEQFGDELVFRTSAGQKIESREMLRRLDEDDDVAMELVRDLHAAALATLRVRAKRDGGAQ